ncbi:hypothetical protein BDZ89DRAFT_1137580 [Hymenopellis radicata]|nr:hypothetical protein BDZ89DRAFT_1137580 [Hymenopellis radicata]
MDEGDIDFGHEFDTLCPKNHPWNLSHVCQRWREITLSTPRLWSTIYLNFKRYKNLSQKQCVFKGILLFERSGNLDLSMHLFSGMKGISDHPLISFFGDQHKALAHLDVWPSNMVLAAVFRMFVSVVTGIGHSLQRYNWKH